jgi:epoxyqueuosine reductase
MTKAAIRQRARELGFDDCRFTHAAAPASANRFQEWLAEKRHGEMAWLERTAPKRLDLQHVLPQAKSVICLAVSYETSAPSRSRREEAQSLSNQSLVTSTPAIGLIARYARFNDYHDVLGARLKQLTTFVDQLGGAETRSLWYVDTGPLLERDLAQRAGLGFVGKHTNLISRKFGNWLLLAEIITTLELEPDAPEQNHCGKCTRCLTACPTNAITAPFQLDARRCISYLTIELKGSIPVEFRPAIGNRIFGCDDCLAACPWNRFAHEGSLMKTHARSYQPAKQEPAPSRFPSPPAPGKRVPAKAGEGETCATTELTASNSGELDLFELLQLDEAGFKSRFAGTPVLRTKRRGLLRNVCVALGNVGDASALAHLQKAAHDPEPLIAEHAHWAIAQIKSRQQNSQSPITG